MKKLKLAYVGLGSRGFGMFKDFWFRQDDVVFTDVCDARADRAETAAEAVRKAGRGNPRATTDYRDVMAGDADAVIVATSWETHAEVCAAAMRAGKAPGMEVGGVEDLNECWELVRAHEETGTPFMFLENCCYHKDELLALKLARAGVLGEIVHCSGAYTHDLRECLSRAGERGHYRLDHYLRRNCENYPTHELGPIAKILDINRGNRMTRLVAMASKAAGMERFVDRHGPDSLRGKTFAQGDIFHTLIQCENGESILLKLDTTLPGFYDRELTVKGTGGMYMQSGNLVVIDGVDNKDEIWEPTQARAVLGNNAARYDHLLPEAWRSLTEEQRNAGHGGMDYFLLRDFIERARTRAEMPIDVYDAAAWMSITALSAESVRKGGAPVEIPDFTNGKWRDRPRNDVM